MNENTSGTSSFPDDLGPIAESFLARLRRGEHPSVKEYADRFPEHAERIHEVFPALAEVELAAVGPDASRPGAGSHVRSPKATAEQAAGPRTETAVCVSTLLRLGDYRIIREIGGGGMGIVYEAEREALHSRVALKVMHPKLRNRSDHLRWFLREARAAAGLHHTNIVTVIDYGRHDDVCYYAMQYIAGHSLDRVLDDVRRLKRHADAVGGRNESADLTDAGSATAASGPVDSAGALLRTVTMGLLQGRFPDGAAGLGREYVAAMAEAMEHTQAAPTPATEATSGEVAMVSRAHPQAELPANSLSSNATSTPGSSWIGKPSLRYQREIARIGSQVADALDYAHKRRVIHRDIKPHNILLDALGNAWITDFGLAKLKEEENQSTSQAFAGTLRYMAPERLQGKSDGRDDIYALAATLYEFLALRPVFDASDPHQLLSKVAHEPPTPLRRIDRQVHPDLAAIIERSLAKDPSDRYSTAAELRDELRRFLEGRPVKTRPVPTYARLWKWCKRNPWLAAANIAAAVLTTTLAIGSTIAAKVYKDKNEQLSEQAHQLRLSEIDLRIKDRDSRLRLFESQVERARAGRFSHRAGQRFGSLAALAQAAKIGRELKLPAARLDRLRDEAIACMALPDMKPAGLPITLPQDFAFFAYDPGMTRYAIRLLDGTVLVHRMSDNLDIARFKSEGDREIWVFAFSPDGHYLVSQDWPSVALNVWEVDRKAFCLRDTGRVANSAAGFSPDSQHLAVAHNGDYSLVIYDLKSGKSIKSWHGPALAQDLVYRPDGKQVAVSYHTSPPSCHIFDAETGALLRAIPIDFPAQVAWSPDGKRLLFPAKDDQIWISDAATGEHTVVLKGVSDGGVGAVFDTTGTMVISNGWSGRLRLWDAVLGQQILNLTGYGHMCSRDNRTFLRLGTQANSWQIDTAIEYRTFAHASSTPLVYQFSSIRRDGRILAAGTDRGLVLWDLASGAEIGFLPIGRCWGGSIFEASGDLVTNSPAGVWRWPVHVDPTKGKLQIGPPRRLPLPATDCMVVADWSGATIATPAHDLAYIAIGEKTLKVGPLDDCRSASISPDGQWLATGSSFNGGATVWKLPEGTAVVKLVAGNCGVRFSPDGKWLAADSQGTTRLWEVGTWREARKIDGDYVDASADGKLAVFRDSSRTAFLVELTSGLTLARFESPDQYQFAAGILSPDGSRLIVGTNDRPACVHVWDLRAIRRRLAEMGLDWNAPVYPEDDPARADLPPLPPLQVDYGPLVEQLELYSEREEVLFERLTARIKQDPKDTEALHLRGQALLSMNRLEDALADFTAASTRRPQDGHLRAYRGICLFYLRRYAPALDELEPVLQTNPQTLRANPSFGVRFHNRARELANGSGIDRDPALAVRLAELAVALDPDDPSAQNTRGIALYRAGRFSEAVVALEKSLSVGKGQFDAFDLFFLAMAHQRLGHREDARPCFDRGVRWLHEHKNFPPRQAQELAAFRAEAEAVLAGPGGEMPENVFERPRS
jgi:serine/threonine protein kinase/WD40 repeat protein/tetratricopeptide (TPR) repeat protein